MDKDRKTHIQKDDPKKMGKPWSSIPQGSVPIPTTQQVDQTKPDQPSSDSGNQPSKPKPEVTPGKGKK